MLAGSSPSSWTAGSQRGEPDVRHTGIPIIGDVPWGTHFCQFYQDQQDLIDTLIPYFKAGLQNNEFCMWITSEPLRADEARFALSREIPNLEDYLRKGQIEILDYSQWYTVGGRFEAGPVLQGWVEKLDAARKRGFDGLRLTGNTFWLVNSDWQDFTEYEAMVDGVIGQYPMLAICTYSLAKCGAAEIMDVVANHAFALIKRAGKWQVVESAERKRMETALRESEAQLRSATHAAEIGVWSWTPGTNEVVVSGQWRQLFGVPPDAPVTFETWRNALHPEDRDRAVNELNIASEQHRDFNTEYRVIWPDGTTRWLVDRGRAAYDARGRAIGMAGVNVDITARKSAEEALRQQREWLRVTLTSIGDAVLATDTAGRITFLNGRAAASTGWPEEEALGRPVQDVFRIVNERTREESEDIVGRVLREGCVVSLANDTSLLARDGREIPIEDSAAPIRDGAGNISGVVLVFHEVTEKRRAQEALRQSEQRVRLKLESILSPEGDIGNLELGDIIDAQALQALLNDFYELARLPMAIIDLKGKVLVGVGWQEICTRFHRVHPQTCANCIESDTVLTRGVPEGEFRLYKCKNHMWDVATPLITGGMHVGNLFSGQFFFDDEPLDYDLFRSQAAQYGFNETAYIAALEAVPRLSRKRVDVGLAFLRKLGHMISVLSYSNIKLARSLADRDALMNSLKRSEALYRGIARNLPDGSVYLVDREMRFLVAEGSLMARLGQQRENLEGRTLREALRDPEWRIAEERYSRALAGEPASYEGEHAGCTLWSHYVPLRDESGTVVGAVSLWLDITARKRGEEQLRHTQKLESLGLLAGGIAHDFNNLLVGIIGYASMAEDMLPHDSPAAESLKRIVESGEHAAHLTRQMLAYAGKGRFILEPVDLSAMICKTRALFQSSISKKINLAFQLEPGIPPVETDPSQMQQVFMNLALNAAEAIGDNPGVISVSTGETIVDGACTGGALSGWNIEPGRYVFLEVRDTGSGMDAATQAKIFDPFFTTKFQGRGLGLAAVAGIVRAHKGAIELTTAPGAGSTFRVLLPAAQARPPARALPSETNDDLRGKGTILVVDDEQVVRDLARQSLERHGYKVLVAENGPAAIDIVQSDGHAIELVLLDLGMPGMSGEETLPHLRKIKPDLHVIVSSGYSETETLRLFKGARVSAFIQKPYTARQLAAQVKSVLE